MSFSPAETGLPAEIWQSFAANRPAVRCSAGYLIYLQDTQATCFYYLKSGRVKSYIQAESGEQRVLQIFESGALFGEASFLDELPRVSSAVAMSDCEIVPIDRELVVEQIAQRPEYALAMLKYLARKVRALSGQVDDMAFRPADQRIARYLLSLSTARDQHVRCTQEDIAAGVSASRVTVNRTLNDFLRNGWIKTGYGTVTIVDRAALSTLSGK